jgi:hypothetical protein
LGVPLEAARDSILGTGRWTFKRTLANRPEGYLLSKIEEAFAKAGGLDDMRLLDIVGGKQIGRLS